ncbi:MAG: hypothetical protein ABJE66_04555 [Deltaproteobacteria bacterium]
MRVANSVMLELGLHMGLAIVEQAVDDLQRARVELGDVFGVVVDDLEDDLVDHHGDTLVRVDLGLGGRNAGRPAIPTHFERVTDRVDVAVDTLDSGEISCELAERRVWVVLRRCPRF